VQELALAIEPPPERWAPILEAPGYEVSTWGRLQRIVRAANGAELLFDVATWENAKGYYCANLEIAGVPRLRYVHRLVLRAFRPDPGINRAQGNHENGNKGDNRLENLAWTSASGNARHAHDTGLIRRRPTRELCRHGHPRQQLYRSKSGRTWRRCARCRRLNRRRVRARDGGFQDLPGLLDD
jgi:hypothetical protein